MRCSCDLQGHGKNKLDMNSIGSFQLLGVLASHRDDFSCLWQFIEIVRPSLHHCRALRPMFRAMSAGSS